MNYNKVKVHVCGKEYSLQTTESPAYVNEIARQLDKKINEMMNSNDTISSTTAAVLVGLGLIDDSLKTNSDIDNIRTQITSYVEEAATARLEVEKMKQELENKNREIGQLKTDLELFTLKGQIN
jgi:cell division protein ZapA